MNAVSAAVSTIVVCALPLAAQEARTGVSTPPPTTADSSPVTGQQGIPAGYQPTPAPGLLRHDTPTNSVDSSSTPAESLGRPTDEPSRSRLDADAGIVTRVPHVADEISIGTTFKARMRETVSTESTKPGTSFTAELVEPVQQDGHIVIPTGTTVEGKVTEIRSGRRIHGAAALHLDPRSLVFPDGSRHVIHGQVIDTSESFATRIDAEGTIVRRDHVKRTLAAMGLATGASTVAGAMIGGGVGALVGAGIGAGLSTAWWLKQDRQTVLPENTAVVFSLNEAVPMAITGR